MFSVQKYGGISKYFCELMKNYPEEYQFKLAILFSENQHLKDNYKIFKKLYLPLPAKDSKVKGILKRNTYKINNSYSKYVISSGDYDLFHPTYYDPYFLENLKKPYIITVHDLIQFKFKDQYKNNSLIPQMKKIIRKANRIISISENTKKDLIEILNINPEKIDVVHHGFTPPATTSRLNRYGRYILFVGYRGGYKNFSMLIRAFSNLIIYDEDLKLICVGQPFTKDETEELINNNIYNKTIVLGANEELLNQLYSNALVFVYPTLYEGFGMSILEAFANNCPVCLSNTSSLPEVAGNAGIYFDPRNADSITHAIKKIIYDPELSQKMIREGNLRLANFSWKKCAEQTVISHLKALS
jgi:glycosyltransferase involved in cell wall biosynthesis